MPRAAHRALRTATQATALRHFEKTAAMFPKSRRNLYYVCLAHTQAGHYDDARESCAAAAAARCDPASAEADICDFLGAQIARLQAIASRGAA